MTELLPNRPAPEPTRGTRRAPAPEEGRGHPLRLAALASLVVLAGVAGGWSLLVMIAALVVMIFLHELGHYLTAKWAGMKVTEFFIGFGPRIWSFRRGETEYGLKVLPAGAYVKIIGMHNLDEYDEADANRTYMSKPFWRRLSVAVAGSTMHFILALVCLFVAFSAVGLPAGSTIFSESDVERLRNEADWIVGVVALDSAASDIGIREGDRIVSVDGVDTSTFDEFAATVSERADETVTVVVERDGEPVRLETTIGEREDAPGQGFFGVGFDFPSRTVGVADAVDETLNSFGNGVRETFRGLGTFLSPSGLADIGSQVFAGPDDESDSGSGSGGGGGGGSSGEVRPVSIVGIADGGAGIIADGRWGDFLVLFAVVNIFIGVFNLLPLLPLDGGHVAIACYEKVRSLLQGGAPYHVDVVKLLPLTYAVVIVMAFLGISTLYLDIADPIGG